MCVSESLFFKIPDGQSRSWVVILHSPVHGSLSNQHRDRNESCQGLMTSSKTFSASLAICAGNSPVTGEFPAHRPVTRSFDVFFDLRLNKRLSKQQWGWWFGTPSRPLWRHCNGIPVWLVKLPFHLHRPSVLLEIDRFPIPEIPTFNFLNDRWFLNTTNRTLYTWWNVQNICNVCLIYPTYLAY